MKLSNSEGVHKLFDNFHTGDALPGNHFAPSQFFLLSRKLATKSVPKRTNITDQSNVPNFRTALLPPTLITPIVVEQCLFNHPTFEWNDVPHATGYIIEISTNAGFTSTFTNTVVTSSIFIRTTDLPFGAIPYIDASYPTGQMVRATGQRHAH